jgi:Cid1 family poly A polymerase
MHLSMPCNLPTFGGTKFPGFAPTVLEGCCGCEEGWKRFCQINRLRFNFNCCPFKYNQIIRGLFEYTNTCLDKNEKLESVSIGYASHCEDAVTSVIPIIACTRLELCNLYLTSFREVEIYLNQFKDVEILDLSGNYLNYKDIKLIINKYEGNIKQIIVNWNFVDSSLHGSVYNGCKIVCDIYKLPDGYPFLGKFARIPDKLENETPVCCPEWPSDHHHMNDALEDNPKVLGIIRSVQGWVDRVIGGDNRVSIFGSGISGLYDIDKSDIDLTIEHTDGSMVRIDDAHAIAKQSIDKLGRYIRNNISKRILVLSNARIPLIRIYGYQGIKEINIIYGYNIGLLNSRLIKEYIKYDHCIYLICNQIKAILKKAEIIDINCLSSYSVVLMVIFYMQYRLNIIPSLQQFAREHKGRKEARTEARMEARKEARSKGSKEEGIVECGPVYGMSSVDGRYMRYEAAREVYNNGNRVCMYYVRNLIQEFFNFYAYGFDYKTMTVDINQPFEQEKYKDLFDRRVNSSASDRDKGKQQQSVPVFMVILDPFEGMSRNLAKGMHQKSFNKMIEFFKIYHISS